MFDLQNKIALVTGARRGMGRTHALALARQGAKVAVTDIDLPECQKVVAEIANRGGEALALRMDVSNKAEVDAAVEQTVRKFGRLDILVNNAGIYEPKAALELSEEEWERTVSINLKGQFLCAQRAAREMAKNKWGRIINIASVASGQVGVGISGGAHYTATKGGVIGMTESLAIEWALFGITVNVIGPGAIDTPMVAGAKMSKEVFNAFMSRIPMHRMGRPEEVSSLVVFLASDESSYVTGATFFVDGGWLAA